MKRDSNSLQKTKLNSTDKATWELWRLGYSNIVVGKRQYRVIISRISASLTRMDALEPHTTSPVLAQVVFRAPILTSNKFPRNQIKNGLKVLKVLLLRSQAIHYGNSITLNLNSDLRLRQVKRGSCLVFSPIADETFLRKWLLSSAWYDKTQKHLITVSSMVLAHPELWTLSTFQKSVLKLSSKTTMNNTPIFVALPGILGNSPEKQVLSKSGQVDGDTLETLQMNSTSHSTPISKGEPPIW